MYLVAIAWIYVVLMMSIAEVMHPDGTLLGALITFLLYGVLPLAIVLYIMGARLRRKKTESEQGT
jgi:membrane protein implicated in regulation of membrane protease activity